MSDDRPDRLGIRAPDSSEFFLEFDTAHEEFHRGFQCGEIWACLVDKVAEIQAVISAENSEMVLRMTEVTGYEFQGRYLTQAEISALDLGKGEWMAIMMRLK